MVAGQSCIASPAVFPTSCYSQLTCALHLPCASVGTQDAPRLCLREVKVCGSVVYLRTSTLKCQACLEVVHKHSLRYCQATYRFFYVTLATHTEQAFLCPQGHFCLDIYGTQLPWMLLDRFSTCVSELARLYVQ